jgi:pantetheine-phosphate adenylyltransferase
MSYVVVGGTFDNLHKGHRAIIEKAFAIGEKVLVGITSNRVAREKAHSEKIQSYGERRKKVAKFLEEKGWLGRAEFVEIWDPFSDGIRPGLGYIVVSPGTRENAERINSMRKTRHLEPLRIIEVEWIPAEDGRPISDERIRKGEIDAEGRILRGKKSKKSRQARHI